MKTCYTCHYPIYEPALPDTAIEKCPCCDEMASGLDQLKQQAYIDGIDLLWPADRPNRNRVVLDSSLER